LPVPWQISPFGTSALAVATVAVNVSAAAAKARMSRFM
jgi:hypothetical protein